LEGATRKQRIKKLLEEGTSKGRGGGLCESTRRIKCGAEMFHPSKKEVNEMETNRGVHIEGHARDHSTIREKSQPGTVT